MSQLAVSRGLLLILLTVLVASSLVDSRRIDCTRFVFAPKCRGVAAKRASNSLTEDSTELDDTYPEPLMTREASQTRDEGAEKILRLLFDLSHSERPQARQVPRNKEFLDSLLRS